MEQKQSTSSRLAINKPIGHHGDAVLEMQVRYANDDALRQRIVEPHKTKRSTRPKVNESKEASVGSFLEMAQRAAASGDPESARKALEHLATVEQHSHFSVVGDFADLALLSLRRRQNVSGQPTTSKELKQRRLLITGRRRKRGIGIGLIYVVGVAVLANGLEGPLGAKVAYVALFTVFLLLFVIPLLKREDDAKKLVDELHDIASIEVAYTFDAEHHTVDSEQAPFVVRKS